MIDAGVPHVAEITDLVATSPTTWATPLDGVCPADHPVKVTVASGVYHVAGDLSYARTSADRCYATPQDAEADGFRRAKL